MSKPYMVVTQDFTKDFQETIKRFKSDSVLIGIPETEEAREDGAEITNAALLAINHFGSAINNIPPRQPLFVGIRNSADAIAEEFKKAAKNVLSKGASALEVYYQRAGMLASNAVKKAINDQEDIEPPSEATLRARKYLTESGFKGTKSLVVTGQMRNAITYVVQSIWGK